jgi:demethylmenaquinone methyltransferase/2-methoxy-6-polyprenyl-1,4-benzoquinol methylase
MDRYYRDRVPYHDVYMDYQGPEAMEDLLAPIIDGLEGDIAGRDVLEVACGTGNWTQVLARRARSVTATDVVEDYLELARSKDPSDKVVFRVADAYSLEGVEGTFDAAFAGDWWSHVPRSMEDAFLRALCGRLSPGARVVLVDMLRTPSFELAFLRFDAEGNEVQLRTLPNGETYEVLKNFPHPEVLKGRVEAWGEDITYHEYPDLQRWMLRFTVASP